MEGPRNVTPGDFSSAEIHEPPMTPSEVATLFRVDAKTVTRWADERRLPSFRTPGGHRRFPAGEVRFLRFQNFTPATG
ncbi:excisionase family DNA binding protein [Nocardiopsis sp. Huas11]|nr:excisionase family DNA binding protein [Nocardiopsis sp. Huas11]